MKNERYKRLYIKESYLSAEESTIETRMDHLITNWTIATRESHPNFEYRIINAETQTIIATNYAGQNISPTIRFVVHIAYTL